MARTNRRIVTFFALLLLVAGGAMLLWDGSTAEVQEQGDPPPIVPALPDVGRFRAGADLGEERAGFSGLPKLQVFTSPEDPDWGAITACLASQELETAATGFTPILVDERVDTTTEGVIRDREGFVVVARGLNGKFLGGLPAGFSCGDLVELLELIERNRIQRPHPSPIYARMLDAPEAVVDSLVSRGEADRAAKFVDFLREFEGDASPAAAAADARLPR